MLGAASAYISQTFTHMGEGTGQKVRANLAHRLTHNMAICEKESGKHFQHHLHTISITTNYNMSIKNWSSTEINSR